MTDREELKYLMALKQVNGIGDILIRFLLQHAGSATEVFRLPAGKLLRIPKISERIAKTISAFRDFDSIEKELEWYAGQDIEPITFKDHQYPQRLLTCHDAPVLLFSKGNIDLNPKRIINVIGTRKCTEYGKWVTEQIVAELAKFQTTIVSGLALGIDAAAHKAALQHQLPTIGVLGHGLDMIYPGQHHSLAKKMQENGGLLTEFQRNTQPDKGNFPMRNRIVAGMCDATILVESAESGGAMITAEYAHAYQREVIAIPGRWTDETARGPLKLIYRHKATILTDPAELAAILGWEAAGKQLLIDDFYERKALFNTLDEEERKIVDVMVRGESIAIDQLHYLTGIPVPRLSSTLLSLEFKGAISPLPGKRFLLI